MPAAPNLLWPYQSVHPWTNGTEGILSDQARLWLNALTRKVGTGGTGGTFTAGGDLSGTNTVQTVVGIEGRPVSATAPADGQVLTWIAADGMWEPHTGATVTFAGDLTGTSTSQTVIGLQNRHLSNAAPANGQVLTWVTANNDWEPQTPAAAGVPVWMRETPVGTMNGTNKTFTISFTPNPSASFVLYLNGVEQVPATDFSISAATITYTVAPKSNDLMIAEYTH